MTVPPLPFSRVGLIGAGAMGRGIAQVMAQAGATVLLFDTHAPQVAEARDFIEQMLKRTVEKGRLTVEAAARTLEGLQPAPDLEALKDCDLIVEAIVEDLAVKQQLFAQLEALVSDTCVLATNTSSLSVTQIAAGCRRPERVAGYHFFNPVPLMKVVEVIGGQRTAPEVLEPLKAFARSFGHTPVQVEDSPGFLINHAGRGLTTEGLRILQEGVALPHEIDRIMRKRAGFRMGPCELLDLTGLDVSHPVMVQIYEQFFHEPRFRPTPQLARRHAAGLLGRKTHAGFYTYENGQQQLPDTRTFPRPATLPEVGPVWVSPRNPERASRVQEALEAAGVTCLSDPTPEALCLITPLGWDATTALLDEGLNPAQTVAVETLLPLDTCCTLMGNPLLDPTFRARAEAAFTTPEREVVFIRDSPGFVGPRILAAVINTACELAQQRIATPEDIDLAVQRGLGYPLGPLGWGDQLGPANLLTLLEALHACTQDPRYRPSLWLRRRAQLKASLTLAE